MTLKGITRREAVKLGLGSAMLGSMPLALHAQSNDAIEKVIPSTGEKLPVIGIGTNSFNLAEQDTLEEVLSTLVAEGGRVIDTAAGYGESEQTIGNILAKTGLHGRTFISTKLTAGGGMGGPPPGMGPGSQGGNQGGGQPPMGQGGPGGGQGPMNGGNMPQGMPGGMGGNMVSGKESFERSLERLQTDKVDLLMVHNMNGLAELMPQLQDWKKAGLVRYVGTTTSNSGQHEAMMAAMNTYDFDFVQVNYSLGDRDAEEGILPLAAEKGIAIMCNVPFGGRGGRTLSAVLDKPLPVWAADIGATSWAQILLKYIISHPAVTVAIPGSTKARHVVDNQKAGHGPLPDAALRARIARDWDDLTA